MPPVKASRNEAEMPLWMLSWSHVGGVVWLATKRSYLVELNSMLCAAVVAFVIKLNTCASRTYTLRLMGFVVARVSISVMLLSTGRLLL